jgi:hypothetical protein
MAVYAPGDSPGDSLDPMGQGIDPGMWARLMGYINPIQPAAADTLNRAPNPLNNPSPVDSRLVSGGPPVPPELDRGRQRALLDAQAQLASGSPQNINTPPTTGPWSGIQHAAAMPVNLPPAGGSIPIGGGPGNAMQAPTGPQNIPIGGGPGNLMEAPTGTAAAPMPPVRPKNLGQPVVRRRPAVIPASATASVPAARSPWITDQAQNQDIVRGGALTRGGGGRPMGMLDLSRLFARQ